MMEWNGRLMVSREDYARIMELAGESARSFRDATAYYLFLLKKELQGAHIRPAGKMPRDVVRLGSDVQVTDLDSGARQRFAVVLPTEADGNRRLSVLCPLGMAVFGYRAGDRIEWGPVDRLIRLDIDRVSHRVAAGAGTEPNAG